MHTPRAELVEAYGPYQPALCRSKPHAERTD
jgi:hypothetical protein